MAVAQCRNPLCYLDETPPRIVDDGAVVCVQCRRRLQRWITGHTLSDGTPVLGLGGLHHALSVRLIASGGQNRLGIRSSSRKTGLLVNDPVSCHRLHMIRTVESWVDFVVEKVPVTKPADRGMFSLLTVLVTYLDWLAWHNPNNTVPIVDFYQEVRELRSRAFALAYPAPRGQRKYPIGQCFVNVCPGVLWGTIAPRDEQETPSELLCDADEGHRWPAGAWAELRNRELTE